MVVGRAVQAMGVYGLAGFVHSKKDSLLEPFKLRGTTVIIDGNNFIHKFFRDDSESKAFVFGGDYDYLYSRVTDFFGRMLKCGITPILLFDGCQPEIKFETINLRREEKLESLIRLSTGAKSHKPDPIQPMLLYEAFKEGLNEMGITYRQMYEEADPEIAVLAKNYKCPVLSDDSDFFIYDVDLVPLRNMDCTCEKDKDGSLYFPCQIYRSGNLSKLFPKLQKSILPMVDIIVGNRSVGKDFIHVFTESGTKKNIKQKINDIFEILQTIDDRETVITRILESLDSKEVEGVESTIRKVLRNYDLSLSKADVETRTTRDATPSIYGMDLSELPEKFLDFYTSHKLDSFMLGLLRYQRHNLSIPIEDIKQDSCHFSSVPIIREIYKILRTFMKAPDVIILNLRVQEVHGCKTILKNRREICASQDYTRTVRLRGNVLKEDEHFRRKVFFQSLSLDEMDGERLREFDGDWILFLTSVVYWVRNQRNLTQSHLSAVLLMALSIYVESMGDRAEGRDPHRPFTYSMKCIPDSEYAKFRDRFNQVKRSDRDILARDDYFRAMHAFACLQSILLHVIQLNNLLGELFPGFRVSRFYSGTFLLNLFVLSEAGWFAKKSMEDLPQMRATYGFLENSVNLFLGPSRGEVKKTGTGPGPFSLQARSK